MQTRLPTEERQAEIVAAALRLARDSSPALITTTDIASAIGVTQGAVFKHFPDQGRHLGGGGAVGPRSPHAEP